MGGLVAGAPTPLPVVTVSSEQLPHSEMVFWILSHQTNVNYLLEAQVSAGLEANERFTLIATKRIKA